MAMAATVRDDAVEGETTRVVLERLSDGGVTDCEDGEGDRVLPSRAEAAARSGSCALG